MSVGANALERGSGREPRCLALLGLAFLVCFGAIGMMTKAAGAQSLTIVPDKTTYALGDPIVVQIRDDGSSSGRFDPGIYARLVFDPTHVSGGSVTPVVPTSGGVFSWFQGPTPCAADSCDVVTAVNPNPFAPFAVDAQLLWSTATLTAVGLGTTDLCFEELESGLALDFFGQTSAPCATITVEAAVPAMGPVGTSVLGLLVVVLGVGLRRVWGSGEPRRGAADGAEPPA